MIELVDHIGHLTTSGLFSLDGQDFEVENNVWIVGDSSEVLVIDAPHSAAAIARAVGNRRVVAIVATHGHNDHINAAVELRELVSAPVLLHPDDLPLWRDVYGSSSLSSPAASPAASLDASPDGAPDASPDGELSEGLVVSAGGVSLAVLHTPGHTPGGCCLYDGESGVLFSGDTLFRGGPGATGRSWSDFPTIIESIRSKLLSLPPETRVLTGHGDETRIGEEAPHLEEWIARGH